MPRSVEKLGENFSFVNEPGPDTMRFRIALTEARSAKVALDVGFISAAARGGNQRIKNCGDGTWEPASERPVPSLKRWIQCRGERLAAGVDKRIGSKYTGRFDKFSKWRATQAAFDYWAERLKTRLGELQNKPAQNK